MAEATRNLTPVSDGIPADREARDNLRQTAMRQVAAEGLPPPLSVACLRRMADELLAAEGWPSAWSGFAMVAINNALWGDAVAATDPAKRLLLLPQCLRQPERCRGEFDDYGFVCADCGGCPIAGLQRQAEAIGCTVLVAEATAVVESLIGQGRFEAIVGVGCLEALEGSFQRLADRALPSLAVPLLQDGCHNTTVDDDWVEAALVQSEETSVSQALFGLGEMVDLDAEVSTWFSPEAVAGLIGEDGETVRLAVDWVAGEGKRWRPFLLAAVARAVATQPLDESVLRHLALAIECFHKASLIHDDIEDDDAVRYGKPALHVAVGLPTALNVGDFLIGEGYRLAAVCGLPSPTVARQIAILANAHRSLCLGQGAEFSRWRQGGLPTVAETTALFELKTVPAFAAALVVGALSGGADEATCERLRRFSRAVGVGYQIRDDLADFESDETLSSQTLAASILVAKLGEADGGLAASLYPFTAPGAAAAVARAVRERNLTAWAKSRLDELKLEAQTIADDIAVARLKQLLYRVAGRLVKGRSVT